VNQIAQSPVSQRRKLNDIWSGPWSAGNKTAAGFVYIFSKAEIRGVLVNGICLESGIQKEKV
jgi:hypothetical protein